VGKTKVYVIGIGSHSVSNKTSSFLWTLDPQHQTWN